MSPVAGAAPRFSLVVPSRGEEGKLLPLLEALSRQTLDRGGFEALVVLDGTAASAAVTRRAGELGVRLHSLPERRGPGAARNAGARLARGDYLAFTEDDCTPAPDWLERAAERLAAEPGLDVLEGATLKPDGRPVRRRVGEALTHLPTNLFVRRSLFERVGGYCEDFFDPRGGIYFREDSDLGFTLEEAGARVGAEPQAVVVHPEEHPRFLDPLRWARRYRMDPLLERRHPRLFRERIEVHRMGPFVVRRPVVRACVCHVVAFLAAGLAAVVRAPGHLVAGFLGLAGAALLPVWAKWRFHPLRLPVCLLVPWVISTALVEGAVRRPGTRVPVPPRPRRGVDNNGPTSGLGHRLVLNTLHAASGRLVTLGLWLLFTPAILRALGPEQFAIWSLFFALTGYLSSLDFGLAQGTLRFVAAERGRGNHAGAGDFSTLAILGYAVLAAGWLALAAALGAPLLAWLRIPAFLEPPARFVLAVGALVFGLSGSANVVMAVLQGCGRFDLANRALLAMSGVQAAGFGLVLARRGGIEGFVLAVATGAAFGLVVALLLLRAKVTDFRWGALPGAARALNKALGFGTPMQVTNFLAAGNAHLDKVLIARYVDLARVTSYELGSRVALSATSLPQLLLMPVMAEAAALGGPASRDRMRELYDRGSRYFLTLAALCVATLLAAAPRLYAAWLGAPHPEATRVLQWLTVAAAITLATGMGTALARGVGRTDLETWFAVATVTLHLALSLLLLPRAGLAGALTASVVSHLVGSLLFMALFARLMAWRLLRDVLRPWVVPTLAALLGWASGAALERALPQAGALAGWIMLAMVAAVAAAVTLGVTVVTRYFHWREARSLVLWGVTPAPPESRC